MKKILPLLAAMLAISPLRAAFVSFPAGTFDGGSSWSSQQTGTASAGTTASGGNNYGQISITGTGTGSLSAEAPATFVPQSLYVVSVDVSTASLAAAGNDMTISVLDGNGNVVGQLTQDEIVNALGIDLGVVNTITSDLTALEGNVDLLDGLRTLLSSLDGNPSLLAAVQQLLDSLVGADPSVVSGIAGLLRDVLDGTLNAGSLTNADIGAALSLSPGSQVVIDVKQVLSLGSGSDDAVAALGDVLDTLADDAGGIPVVGDLLAGLVANDGIVDQVADILAYALSDDQLLPSLTDTLTQSLLGITDPSDGGFQTVKLIFTTDASLPVGQIGIDLSAGATLAAGQTTNFDNVTIERFALLSRTDPSNVTINGGARPLLRVAGKKLRQSAAQRQTIHGRAKAYGAGNSIVRVEYKVAGPNSKTHGYRKAAGKTRWHLTVRKVSGKTRVLIRSVDANGRRSPVQRVFLVRER